MSYAWSRLSPAGEGLNGGHRIDRAKNYRRLLLYRSGNVECKLLYRAMTKIEKPLRRDKVRRQDFVLMLYRAACDPSIDYMTVVKWLKDTYRLCLSEAEVRQLVLYCGIFGPTDNVKPSSRARRYVLKNCVMSVPRLHMFKRWCKDVKRLESCPRGDRNKGFFASKPGDDDTSTIHSFIEDFQSYDMDGVEDDPDDDCSLESTEETIKPVDRLKKSIKSVMALNALGSLAHKKPKYKYIHRRKKANPNVYSYDDMKPEFNKFISRLGRGTSREEVHERKDEEVDVRYTRRSRITDALFLNKSKPKPPPSDTEREERDIAAISERSGSLERKLKKTPSKPRMSMAVITFKRNSKVSPQVQEDRTEPEENVTPEDNGQDNVGMLSLFNAPF